jgi:hypothetical protein
MRAWRPAEGPTQSHWPVLSHHHLQRAFISAALRTDICTTLEQHVYDLDLPMVYRYMQRGKAFITPRAYVRTMFE